MFYTRSIALASLGAVLLAGTAMARDTEGLTVKQLPKKGKVTLSGTIDSIDDNKRFILRDSAGDTIDVELQQAMELREGDRVKVQGAMDAEFLGMGKEINASVVTVTDRADERSRVSKQDKGTALTPEAIAKLAPAMGTPSEEVHTRIQALPKRDNIVIRGMVEALDKENKSLVLKDTAGDTIDVYSKDKLQVSKGDIVQIKGMVTDEVAGIGAELHAEEVTTLKR